MKKYFLLASILFFQSTAFCTQPAPTFNAAQISEALQTLQKLSQAEFEEFLQAQEENNAQLIRDICSFEALLAATLMAIGFCLFAQPYLCGQFVDCINCTPEAIQSFAQRVWCVAHCDYPTH